RVRVEQVRSGLSIGDCGAVVRHHSRVRRDRDSRAAAARQARVLVSCSVNPLDSSRRNPLLYLRNLRNRTLAMATPLRQAFDQVRRAPLVLFVLLYTVVTGGPLLWVATMSLRTTAEIFKDPYGVPSPIHWAKFADAWTKSNYGTYFWNSAIVVVSAVALVTVV